LIERLRRVIFTDTRDIDPRTVVLLSLANSTGILKVVFDKKKLKDRKDRIKQIVNGEITGKAATEAIQAMQAAIMVACVMPAFVATTVSH
jgi:pyruvate/2-oxoglutarate dehydrogenase complex dihydrolipoamide dehydrogenase (E3) component